MQKGMTVVDIQWNHIKFSRSLKQVSKLDIMGLVGGE
jgi:hypothetical protein